ncbi:MAG: hypothetical protein NTX86_05055, partial [Candidatus Dependentiae bacterium]|nr:hypothetical protein [Candidatus Dependentiae bacterium]
MRIINYSVALIFFIIHSNALRADTISVHNETPYDLYVVTYIQQSIGVGPFSKQYAPERQM